MVAHLRRRRSKRDSGGEFRVPNFEFRVPSFEFREVGWREALGTPPAGLSRPTQGFFGCFFYAAYLVDLLLNVVVRGGFSREFRAHFALVWRMVFGCQLPIFGCWWCFSQVGKKLLEQGQGLEFQVSSFERRGVRSVEFRVLSFEKGSLGQVIPGPIFIYVNIFIPGIHLHLRHPGRGEAPGRGRRDCRPGSGGCRR